MTLPDMSHIWLYCAKNAKTGSYLFLKIHDYMVYIV